MLQLHPVGFEKGFFGIKQPVRSLPEGRAAPPQTNHTPPEYSNSILRIWADPERCLKQPRGSFDGAQESKLLVTATFRKPNASPTFRKPNGKRTAGEEPAGLPDPGGQEQNPGR